MITVTKDGRIICTREDMRAIRLDVARRAKFHCENCEFKRVPWFEGTLHHITERKMGGGSRNDVVENLMWLCAECDQIEHRPKAIFEVTQCAEPEKDSTVPD